MYERKLRNFEKDMIFNCMGCVRGKSKEEYKIPEDFNIKLFESDLTQVVIDSEGSSVDNDLYTPAIDKVFKSHGVIQIRML